MQALQDRRDDRGLLDRRRPQPLPDPQSSGEGEGAGSIVRGLSDTSRIVFVMA